MERYNALTPVKLRAGSLELEGFSISGLATYVQIPSLDLCFDMGECTLSSLPLRNVFLTHAHGDHSRCLTRHWQLRRMLGIAQSATYFLPAEILPTYEQLIRAEAAFESVPPEVVTLPALVGLEPGGRAVIPSRPDLFATAFPVTHRVPSLGYTIHTHKKKLRAEYVGRSGVELAALRKQGVDVQYDVEEPIVTFIGDCIGASLLEQAHIWTSPVVIIEATFVDPGEEAAAAEKGHTHLREVVHAFETLGDRIASRHIILKHFSMKYSREHVLATIAREIPETFRDRVLVLL